MAGVHVEGGEVQVWVCDERYIGVTTKYKLKMGRDLRSFFTSEIYFLPPKESLALFRVKFVYIHISGLAAAAKGERRWTRFSYISMGGRENGQTSGFAGTYRQ